MTLSIHPTAPQVYPRHIPLIPYTDQLGCLQTLDLWLPRPLEDTDPTSSVWILYVHGGAWRDPTQDSKTAVPAIEHLLGTAQTLSSPKAGSHIAGIASLNYRLSPYSKHSTHPSNPSDPERNVQHPTHIRDVARAVQFLKNKYDIKRWIGVGHSCGATLLLQLVAGIGLEETQATQWSRDADPEALILLEGIYDLPLLLKNHEPPSCPPNIAQIYRDFVEGAFGSPPSDYHSVSPVAGSYVAEKWVKGRYVLLAYSDEDELIENQQRLVMLEKLKTDGWQSRSEEAANEGRTVETQDLKGAHDYIWEDGRQTAELIKAVLCRLFAIPETALT